MIARERDAKALVRRKLNLAAREALTGERIRARARARAKLACLHGEENEEEPL